MVSQSHDWRVWIIPVPKYLKSTQSPVTSLSLNKSGYWNMDIVVPIVIHNYRNTLYYNVVLYYIQS